MDFTIEHLLLGASVLLLLSVLASTASGRLGVPALLLFLAVGMLAGSDGPGGIHFDNPLMAQSLGVVALVFILFAGGLDTEWASVRSAARARRRAVDGGCGHYGWPGRPFRDNCRRVLMDGGPADRCHCLFY